MALHKDELSAEWSVDLERVLYDEEVEKAILEVGGSSINDARLKLYWCGVQRSAQVRILLTARTSTQPNI